MENKFINFDKAMTLKLREGFVVCGDVHFYNAYPYISYYKGVYSSRLLDISNELRNACLVAQRLELPIIINGDLINTGIFDYPVESLLADILLEFKDLTIYINLGNHDLDGDNSVIQPLIDISRSDNHKVFSKPTIEPYITKHDQLEKARFIFVPFMSDEDTNEYLNKLKKDKHVKSIVFIHNSFMGSSYANKIKSKSGISQTIFTKGKLKWVDMVVASHIHKYQELCDGKGFYTSSLIPVDFGERHREHGYHVVDIKKNKRYFVIPKSPRFVYIDADETYSNKEFKKKVNGNIIKILYDKNKTINKEKVKGRAIKSGALFVAFKTKNTFFGTSSKKMPKGKTNRIDAIISTFSEVLAEKYDLEKEQLEKIGLGILEKSIKKSGTKTQKR
jgi:DNA repair exonuclease SbcCD nuclease subunit